MVVQVEGTVIQVRDFTNIKTGEVTPVLDLLVIEPGRNADMVPVYCRDHKKDDLRTLVGCKGFFKVWVSAKSLNLQADGVLGAVNKEKKAL